MSHHDRHLQSTAAARSDPHRVAAVAALLGRKMPCSRLALQPAQGLGQLRRRLHGLHVLVMWDVSRALPALAVAGEPPPYRAKTRKGQTPLMLACEAGHCEVSGARGVRTHRNMNSYYCIMSHVGNR